MNLTRSIALELAPLGVRVNAVSPGAIDTALWASARQVGPLKAAYLAAIPFGQFGQPKEVAAAAEEAGFMTGANLVIDGGLTAATGHPELTADGAG